MSGLPYELQDQIAATHALCFQSGYADRDKTLALRKKTDPRADSDSGCEWYQDRVEARFPEVLFLA
jgi:hypothetical protein